MPATEPVWTVASMIEALLHRLEATEEFAGCGFGGGNRSLNIEWVVWIKQITVIYNERHGSGATVGIGDKHARGPGAEVAAVLEEELGSATRWDRQHIEGHLQVAAGLGDDG